MTSCDFPTSKSNYKSRKFQRHSQETQRVRIQTAETHKIQGGLSQVHTVRDGPLETG